MSRDQIQEAINTAHKNGGDTIHFEPGVYDWPGFPPRNFFERIWWKVLRYKMIFTCQVKMFWYKHF
jgi:hypothetical protein